MTKQTPYFKTPEERTKFLNRITEPIGGVTPNILKLADGSTAARFHSQESSFFITFIVSEFQCDYITDSLFVVKAGTITKDLDSTVKRTSDALNDDNHELWSPNYEIETDLPNINRTELSDRERLTSATDLSMIQDGIDDIKAGRTRKLSMPELDMDDEA